MSNSFGITQSEKSKEIHRLECKSLIYSADQSQIELTALSDSYYPNWEWFETSLEKK